MKFKSLDLAFNIQYHQFRTLKILFIDFTIRLNSKEYKKISLKYPQYHKKIFKINLSQSQYSEIKNS